MRNREIQRVPKDSRERNSLDVGRNSASVAAREELERLEGGLSSLSSFSKTMTRLVDLVKHLFVRDALHSKRLESLEKEIEILKAEVQKTKVL